MNIFDLYLKKIIILIKKLNDEGLLELPTSLNQINVENVKDLEVAWIYDFEQNGDIPGNPIYFNKRVYLSSTDKSLVALKAINGEKIWEFKTEGMAATRGLILNEEEKPKTLE